MNIKEIEKMDKPMIYGKTIVCGIEVPNICGGFGGNRKSLLAKHIAEIHGKKTLHVNEAIKNNRAKFRDGIDILDLKSPGFEEIVIVLVDNNFLSKMEVAKAESILLFSERGYAKLLKIFDDDLAWDKYEEILDGYFRAREYIIDISKLSPELQMFKQLFDSVAKAQLEALETKKLALEANEKAEKAESAIATIKDTFLHRDEDWRKSINSMLNAAAFRLGGKYQDLRSESYRILEERGHCDLNKRLRNLKERLAEGGATKTKIESMTRMDVIEADARLKEIYTTIVKELSIGSLV